LNYIIDYKEAAGFADPAALVVATLFYKVGYMTARRSMRASITARTNHATSGGFHMGFLFGCLSMPNLLFSEKRHYSLVVKAALI